MLGSAANLIVAHAAENQGETRWQFRRADYCACQRQQPIRLQPLKIRIGQCLDCLHLFDDGLVVRCRCLMLVHAAPVAGHGFLTSQTTNLQAQIPQP